MEKEIKMPKLRPEMKEAVLCAWLKNEGDRISVGEPIFEERDRQGRQSGRIDRKRRSEKNVF